MFGIVSILRIAGYKKHSFVDGPGVRFALFTQGCPHGCPGCHNPETWDERGGLLTDTEEIIGILRSTHYLDGITISGGEPLMQPLAVREIAEEAQALGLGVWMYTGWTFEQILEGHAGSAALQVLEEVDVLVDGRFIVSRAYGGISDGTPVWCGSSNQRLIDVRQSLIAGHVVLYRERGMKLA
ncbi:MAG: anaerobic ribonucleoside-triphosphate reductase activating protein [Lachnospiraceae bacterium]|nr:anaerobic ribonucleoside-triphosphate reductase activating protein [Lachnospiraceae bacterium]